MDPEAPRQARPDALRHILPPASHSHERRLKSPAAFAAKHGLTTGAPPLGLSFATRVQPGNSFAPRPDESGHPGTASAGFERLTPVSAPS